MKRKVFWSEEAENILTQITEYLKEEWSDKSANKFLDIVEEKTALLAVYPEMCISSPSKKGWRKCVLTKQVSLLYSFNNSEVNIHTVIDNREENESVF